jgi:rod shape-determining protein MreC
MRGLIQLIYRYHAFLIFLLLQIVCFVFIFNFNRYHKVMFINSSGSMLGGLYEQRANLAEYIRLGDVNDSLAEANALMKNRDLKNYRVMGDDLLLYNDSLYKQFFEYKTARVINVSINRNTNFITLDKGSALGIAEDAGVISAGNLVGIVKEVSDHFAVVMPLINTTFRSTVKLGRTGDMGQYTWDAESVDQGQINEIPKHIQVNRGDSIFTTGFSNYFPENILIGTVAEVSSSPEDEFQRIQLNLATNFRALSHVDIVINLLKEEQMALENQVDQEHGQDAN